MYTVYLTANGYVDSSLDLSGISQQSNCGRGIMYVNPVTAFGHPTFNKQFNGPVNCQPRFHCCYGTRCHSAQWCFSDISDVSLTSLPSDRCDRSTPNTCVVSEGQRVLVKCSADSNPALATVAWQHSGGNVLDIVANRSTSVTQTWDVTTEKRGDDRLPLQDSQEFKVLVTCECVCYMHSMQYTLLLLVIVMVWGLMSSDVGLEYSVVGGGDRFYI